MSNLKPSDFAGRIPYSSYWRFESGRDEEDHIQTAFKIMCILASTGNEWRKLPIREFEAETRKSGGKFPEWEQKCFMAVANYCVSPEKAAEFSPDWKWLIDVEE